MIKAIFNKNDTVTASGAYQYDYGQRLRIEGLELHSAVEVHFSYSEQGGESTTQIGLTSGGATEVNIPNDFLRNGDTVSDYYVFAFIYLASPNSGQTVKKIIIPVSSRPKPEEMNSPENEDLFRAAIEAVNTAADRAGLAEILAESWAHGHKDFLDRDKDNAKYYAKIAKDALQEIPGQVNDAKADIDKYVAAKERELKGETGNVYFAAFKVVNGRLLMYSDPAVDRVRFARNGSRLTYRLAF